MVIRSYEADSEGKVSYTVKDLSWESENAQEESTSWTKNMRTVGPRGPEVE